MSMDSYKALISVIVPVYKVERYIADCVDSILCQTYKNLEIILVDDGSPDRCGTICDEYAAQDSRITVIHKKNGGLSDARNAGLDIAKGDFIAFVDSDDTIEQDAIEVLYCAAVNNNTDITMMNMQYVKEGAAHFEHEKKTVSPRTKRITNDDFLQGLCHYKQSCSFCDKLFRAEVFTNYRFTVNKNNEDLLLLATILLKEKYDVLHVDYIGYYYLRRENSITTTKFSSSIIDTVFNCIDLLNIARTSRPELERCFSELVLYQSRTFVIVIPKEKLKNYRAEYALAVKTIRELKQYIKDAFFSKKDKVFLNLICLSPSLAKTVASLVRKG